MDVEVEDAFGTINLRLTTLIKLSYLRITLISADGNLDRFPRYIFNFLLGILYFILVGNFLFRYVEQ